MTVRKTAYRDIAIFPTRKITYPYPITTVFPAQVDVTVSRVPSRTGESSTLNGEASAGTMMLEELLIVDYRYARFAMDPRTGLFSMVKYVTGTSSSIHPTEISTGIGAIPHGQVLSP